MSLPPTDKTDKTDKTPAAVNEWGIPDWRDPAAYGDVSRWTIDQWRWEFFRRRPDLREWFDTVAKAEPDLYSRYPNKLFTTEYGIIRRFGYAGIPNPRISSLPAKDIKPLLPDEAVHLTTLDDKDPHGLCGTLEARLKDCGVFLTHSQRLRLRYSLLMTPVWIEDHEIAVLFSLSKPIAAQIETAKDHLELVCHERGIKKQKRRHTTKWLGYLRTLDAREAGASWKDIAAIHARTAGTEQTARDIWEAADTLRFNF